MEQNGTGWDGTGCLVIDKEQRLSDAKDRKLGFEDLTDDEEVR